MPSSLHLAKPHSRLLTHSLDWFFPPVCCRCDQPLTGGCHLCAPCAERLPQLPATTCQRCASIFDAPVTHLRSCPSCQALHPAFEFATSALRGSEETIALIHQFKLLKQRHLAKDLAKLAARSFRNCPRLQALTHPILVPIPLHPARERKRGFDQARDLTRELSRELQIPYCDALKRTRQTSRQATLSKAERLQNLRKAFSLRRRLTLAGQNLILIDDVLTTGATASACAQALQALKPKTIAVFTIVRA